MLPGFREEYAGKRGARGTKVGENRPSELEKPIKEPAGSMSLLHAKLYLRLCMFPHICGKYSQLTSDS